VCAIESYHIEQMVTVCSKVNVLQARAAARSKALSIHWDMNVAGGLCVSVPQIELVDNIEQLVGPKAVVGSLSIAPFADQPLEVGLCPTAKSQAALSRAPKKFQPAINGLCSISERALANAWKDHFRDGARSLTRAAPRSDVENSQLSDLWLPIGAAAKGNYEPSIRRCRNMAGGECPRLDKRRMVK
jgi:hypothetical protein